jgi:ATP-dependent helicase YprA (DUF1998 family)
VSSSWKTIFKMSVVHEDQIPALVTRHLLEARKEKAELLYGFKTPALEAGFVEGGIQLLWAKTGTPVLRITGSSP